MASLKIWFCLLLILFLCPSFETRSLDLFSKNRTQKFVDIGKELILEEDMNRRVYDTNRPSPGGPDPHHH